MNARVQHVSPRSARSARSSVTLAAVLAVLGLVLTTLPAASAAPRPAERPTVVLVHGAFADGAGWRDVAERLERRGYPVLVPPNPLRGLEYDSEYLRLFLDEIEGPVVLVGHSYGGAVITNAATGDPDVKSLVYVAAYALDEGEDVAHANALGGHPEESLLLANLTDASYPDAPEGSVDVYIEPDAFREVFAADVDRRTARFMAISQRPGSLASLFSPSGEPAWKTIPSWYMVATQDKAVPPTAERFMAARAGAVTVEVEASHAVLVSRPGAVADLVLDASR